MLIKVKAIIETMVEVEDYKSRYSACSTAISIVREENFACLQLDLELCLKDEVKLSAILIPNKKELPPYAEDWYAWKEDGGTTNKTCGEILEK